MEKEGSIHLTQVCFPTLTYSLLTQAAFRHCQLICTGQNAA